MFDFGFSELVVCGIVGLVVLGPERLPVVAKTAGQWIGKAQRFVQQMKDDINRESELAELKKIKDDAQHIAEDLNESVRSAALGIEKDVNSVAGEAQKNLNDAEKAYEADKPKVATGIDSFNDTPSAGTPTTAGGESTGAGAEQYSGTEFDSSDFAWDDSGSSSNTKIFDKRYIAGPSVDELAEEVEKMQQRLQLERHQFVGNNRKYAPRARVNRPRIYR